MNFSSGRKNKEPYILIDKNFNPKDACKKLTELARWVSFSCSNLAFIEQGWNGTKIVKIYLSPKLRVHMTSNSPAFGILIVNKRVHYFIVTQNFVDRNGQEFKFIEAVFRLYVYHGHIEGSYPRGLSFFWGAWRVRRMSAGFATLINTRLQFQNYVEKKV